jgi:drug/metabolite transporter (DMT)-like permease
MSVYAKAIPLILFGVLLNAFAQIAIKKAVGIAGMEWAPGPLIRLFANPWMLGCLACYAVSLVLWVGALKLVPANYAFPYMALAFVCVALMAKYMLGENIPPMRWIALAVIVAGVCLQAFSGDTEEVKAETAKSVVDSSNGDD